MVSRSSTALAAQSSGVAPAMPTSSHYSRLRVCPSWDGGLPIREADWKRTGGALEAILSKKPPEAVDEAAVWRANVEVAVERRRWWWWRLAASIVVRRLDR